MLDVGCGPGRHAHALARLGIEVVGLDISEEFVRLAAEDAPPGSTFLRGDARDLVSLGAAGLLPHAGAFDAAISLCQGGFGLLRGEDAAVLDGMAAMLRPGGQVAVTGFSAYFAVRFLEESDTFDAADGVNHERTTVRDATGAAAEFDLWTTCFTPRELRLLAERAGLIVRDVWSVAPGSYAARPPDLDHPELLLVGTRPVA